MPLSSLLRNAQDRGFKRSIDGLDIGQRYRFKLLSPSKSKRNSFLDSDDT